LYKIFDNDIIEPVRGPTPWVSPIVPVFKEHGDIRICTDGRILNGAKVISKFNLNSEFNQLELHPDRRDITVFSTHMGKL
jgi:hypothetical protein